MGDLMFGRPFNQLKENKEHYALAMARKSKLIGGITLYSYWMFMLIQRFPVISALRQKWLGWCRSQIEERRQVMKPYTHYVL